MAAAPVRGPSPATARIESAGAAAPVLASFVGILPESEYILAADPMWLREILRAYNFAFQMGHHIMLALLVTLTIIVAPFLGMFSAMWSFAASLARTAAVQIGRALSDQLGYGTYVRTAAQYAGWKRRQLAASGEARAALPAEGIRPSSRFPVLSEVELGLSGPWVWLVDPVRIFNTLFSAGFMAGVVLVACVTFLLSPFIGAFISMATYLYSLIRSFTKAEGRLLTDLLGVSDMMDQSTALMLERMGMQDEVSTPDMRTGPTRGATNTTPLTAAAYAPGGAGATPGAMYAVPAASAPVMYSAGGAGYPGVYPAYQVPGRGGPDPAPSWGAGGGGGGAEPAPPKA